MGQEVGCDVLRPVARRTVERHRHQHQLDDDPRTQVRYLLARRNGTPCVGSVRLVAELHSVLIRIRRSHEELHVSCRINREGRHLHFLGVSEEERIRSPEGRLIRIEHRHLTVRRIHQKVLRHAILRRSVLRNRDRRPGLHAALQVHRNAEVLAMSRLDPIGDFVSVAARFLQRNPRSINGRRCVVRRRIIERHAIQRYCRRARNVDFHCHRTECLYLIADFNRRRDVRAAKVVRRVSNHDRLTSN
ncbi:hypothetical protein D3C76_857360 [compost metagenome]